MTEGERPGISVIIVSFNVRERLDACLQSVHHAAKRFRGTVEVIVFDNASRDGTLSLRQKWPEAVWISSDRNLGYGSGCNRGAAVAAGELLLFLNPDSLAGEDMFRVLWDFLAERADAGVVGGKIVDRDGRLEPACKRGFPSPKAAAFKFMGLGWLFPGSRVFGRYNLTYLDENQTHEVDAVSGAFLCLRAGLFRRVGGFDQDFFLYGEDLDLCFRVKQLGRKNYYHPAARIIHFKGESAKSRPVRSFFNFYEAMIIFSRKHLELRALPLFFLHVGVAALALANFLSRRFRRWRRWLADLAIVNGALAGVTMTYQYFLGGDFLLITHGGLRWFWHSLASLAVLLPMAYIGEYGRAFVPFRAVFLTACGSFLGFFALSYFIQERAYSRVAFALTAVFGVSMMLGWRSLVLRERIWRKIPGLRRRIAILGAGERARETARLVEARPAEFASAEFVGFVPFPPGSATLEMRDRILGDLDSLRGMARKLDLHVLIVALDESAHSAALQALSRRGTGPMEAKLLVGRPEPGKYSLVDLDFRK